MPFENLSKQIGWLVEDTNDGLKENAESGKLKAESQRTNGSASTSPRPSPQGGEGVKAIKFRQVKWKKNALRHSFISYRVAKIQDVAHVALEAGNSPQIIFQHFRELVRLNEAKAWFAIEPGTVAAQSEQIEMAALAGTMQ